MKITSKYNNIKKYKHNENKIIKIIKFLVKYKHIKLKLVNLFRIEFSIK